MIKPNVNDILDMNSSHFLPVGNGEYYFFSKGVFSKKAYVISKEDKEQIELLLKNTLIKLLEFGALFTTISLVNLFWGIGGIAFVGFGLFILVKRKLKNILSNKKNIIVEERSRLDFFISNAKKLNVKNILKRLFISIFMMILICFSLGGEIGNKLITNTLVIFSVIFFGSAVLFDLIHLYFKFKLNFSRKKKK